jgi:N4-gp56 family major capsid protein
MVTKLKTQLVPKINGKYVAVIPYLLFSDLLLDADVRAAMQYGDPDKIWNGWMGHMDGVVFVENSNPFILNATYDATHVATGDKYGAIYIGREAIGCPELKGKLNYSDPRMPSVTVLATPDKSDPNNLQTTIAWKSMWGAKILYDVTNCDASDVPHFGMLWAKSSALAA